MRYNEQRANALQKQRPSARGLILKGKIVMKKILALALAVLMLATTVVALASCGETGDRVKVIDIALSEEAYAFCVNKESKEYIKTA